MGITRARNGGKRAGVFAPNASARHPAPLPIFMAQNLAPCLIGAKSVQICTKPEILRG